MERELVSNAGTAKEMRFRARVEKKTLIQTTLSAKGVPKETRKAFPNETKASHELAKAFRKKMREGWVFLAPSTPRARKTGTVVFECFAPGGGGGAVLDLSPDGKTVLTANVGKGARGYELSVIDVGTGARSELVKQASTSQTFVHTALFDREGGVYVSIGSDTFHVKADGKGLRNVASYEESTAGFNPFVVMPHFDQARKRLVVFDQKGLVKVLAVEGQESKVFEVGTRAKTTECRGAGLSPSGKLLALYISSRGMIYGHEDALHDTTNLVEVYDVDRGNLLSRTPFAEKLDHVGVAHDDASLVVTREYAQGPVGVGFDGKVLWKCEEAPRADRLATAFTWAYSPDGTLLAVGRGRPELYDAATRAPRKLHGQAAYASRTERLIFSEDGTVLAASTDGTCVLYAL